MLRRPAGTLALCLLTWIITTQDVGAFIQVLMPLQSVIDDSDLIFVTKVERIDPDKPSLVLHVQEQLKGQTSMRSLPINLTGDKEAAKAKHTTKLLQRVAPELPIIVCVKKQEPGKFMGLAFTNGTWFQVLGTTDGDQTRWAFTHCEIYLRRTFKGTTEELQQSITDSLAGQKKPPPPNAKEPAGLGPEIVR